MANANICFEIYTRVNGRWELYANHVGQGKQDLALEEARQLERQAHIQGVKVVKETFDPKTNLTTEASIYFKAKSKDSSSDLNKAEPSRYTPPGRSGSAKVSAGGNSPRKKNSNINRTIKPKPKPKKQTRKPRPAKKKNQVKKGNLVKNVLITLFVSMVLSLAVSGLIHISIPKEIVQSYPLISFPYLVFSLAFVFFVVGLSYVFLSQDERDVLLRKSEEEARNDILAEAIDLEEERRRDIAGLEAAQQEIEEAGGAEPIPSFEDMEVPFVEDDITVEPPSESQTLEEQQETKDFNEDSEKLLAEINAELDAEENKTHKEEEQKKTKTESGLSEFDENVVKESAAKIMKFMQRALPYAMQNSQFATSDGFDAYNLFGCHLYLAGAADYFCQKRKVASELHMPVIEKVSQAFSKSKERARQFAARYDEYLLDDKNQEMFRSGRESMSKFMQGEKEAPGRVLTWGLDNWNQRKQQKKAPVAVMFTDIVGSTQFTQDHGDEESHKLVTAHNAIVREALRNMNGREVKHTGDGIMASFANPGQAVPCAVAIMKGAAMHNKMTPQRPIHLRVSINAGEPIEEGGDFFGSTVQLSARINAVCNTDQILVSEVMAEYTKGNKYTFKDFGKHKFKGFKDPIQVFEVPWQGGVSSGMAAAS